jgi:hypothetical protein
MELRKYQAQLEAAIAVSLSPDASRDFIRTLADNL